MNHDSATTATAMTTSHGTPRIESLPIKANGRSGLNTVLSSASKRARPRMAVSAPRVTINGGKRMNAINPPLTRPSNRPKPIPAAIPNMPNCGDIEACNATTAEAARIAPTDRSMPAVRITKVMPAASTTLTEACCVMIDRFCTVRKFSLARAKPTSSRTSTGSMPTLRISSLSRSALPITGRGIVLFESAMGSHLIATGGEVNNTFLGNDVARSPADFGHQLAFAHDQHPIAGADDFRQLAGNHHDAHAGLRQLIDDTVDLGFGADVHAARGFVEDQHVRLDLQQPRQQDLLLIAAGQRTDVDLAGRHANRQRLDRVVRALRSMPTIEYTTGMRVRHTGTDIDVVGHAHVQEQALGLAVFGEVHHAGANRVGWGAQLGDRLAHHFQGAAGARVGAEDQPRQFGAPCPHQAGDTQHFTGMQVEAAVAHAFAVGHVAHAHHHRAGVL